MEIRFAKAQDVPGIIKLMQQAGKVQHAGRPDLFCNNAQKYGPSQIMGMLGKTDAPIFVAVEEEKVLGYGFCVLEFYQQDSVMRDRITLFIDDLYAAEAYRDQQVEYAIYQEILRYAKYRGCYNVTLDVWSCDENAMKFCESQGMKPQKVGMEAIL